ncbi:MAG TPA: redox-regulated ATPase YchF [Candidatus Nanoarchaeia archaeon]|nr:redox-regulated ATPase YchF [Candidatus Nanoarchaeia archaeon]
MLIGIVGKANVGKSTFFKALTLGDVLIANYPFATIKPNSGVAYVKIDCIDKEFGRQCNPREGFCIEHKRFVPVQIIDVAGLVPGAHEGKGLGNQFLDDLRQADVLIHVIDLAGATNEKGEQVEPGSYDPANDIKFLEIELDMWYLGILKKSWERFSKQMQMEKKQPYREIAKQFSGLKVTENMAKEIIAKLNLNEEDATKWTEENLHQFATELRKSTKPMIIAANKIDVQVASSNLQRLKKEFPEHTIIPCSAESELALKEANKAGLVKYIPGEKNFEIVDEAKLSSKQKGALAFIRENVLEINNSTGVQQIINSAVFDLLGCIAVYPGGVNKLEDQYGRVLPDCFLMPPNSTALDFAFKLHTDFGKNFIRAVDVRKKIPVGKEHKLNHCDVIEIFAGR